MAYVQGTQTFRRASDRSPRYIPMPPPGMEDSARYRPQPPGSRMGAAAASSAPELSVRIEEEAPSAATTIRRDATLAASTE